MASKNPLLSWLFGDNQEEDQDSQEPQDLPESRESTQPQAPVRTEAPPNPSKADPFRLELPPDHAVNKLWRMWQDETGRQPFPSFRFEGPDGSGEVLAEAQAKQELARLLLTVNATANQRLNKVTPKGKDNSKEGEEPPRSRSWTPARLPLCPTTG